MTHDSLRLLLESALGCLVWVSVAQTVNLILLFPKVGLAAASCSWFLLVS